MKSGTKIRRLFAKDAVKYFNISQGIVYSDAPSSAELQRITSSFLNWLARGKLAGKNLVTMFLTYRPSGQFLSYFAAQFPEVFSCKIRLNTVSENFSFS